MRHSSCTQLCTLAVSDQWCERDLESCEAYHRAKAALLYYFKFDSFRPGQLAALLPVLHGRDVFAKMPTGAGKSLFFSCTFGNKPLCRWYSHQPT